MAPLGAQRPTISDMWFHLGRIQAVLMSDYREDQICFTSGVYVGQNCDGTLLYSTSQAEHPSSLDLPAPLLASRSPKPDPAAVAYANRITGNQNYHPFHEVLVQLGRLGALRINDYPRDSINITAGMFIGANWDGVVLFRCTDEDENPKSTTNLFSITLVKLCFRL